MMRAQTSTRLDLQNPWPGLPAYDEPAQSFFHGREDEAIECLRLIHLAPLTVLYGKSGLGKTSLLQAGVFPRLRAEHFLPVYLTVDFSDHAECPPLEQVARRLDEEIGLAGLDCPRREPDEELWQYLHRKDLEIWSADNFLLKPVVVFDQFEELFSRGGSNRERIRSVFDRLADLIENRIPTELAGDAADRERRSQLDLLSQRYRIVLVFREDFLPEVETWKDKVPSLLRNRLRLLPMSRNQAIEATQLAGVEVLDDGVAVRIVDFVANREGDTSTGEPAIEPVLLSLCCYQLNRRRAPNSKIDAKLLAGAGQDILEGFYREALAGMPVHVAQFIETQLIQGDRYRGSYPRNEALERGYLSAEQLAALTDRHRLLRITPHVDTARLELIHDRLVGIVRQARDVRLARERDEEQRRLRKEAEREAQRERERREQAERDRARLAKMRNWLLGLAVLLLVAVGIAAGAWWNANQQAAIAQDRKKEAESARAEADEQRTFAEARRVAAERAQGEAERSRQDAEAKRQDAEKATKAEKEARARADSRELAARSQRRLADDDVVGALVLAIESARTAGTAEAERALRDALGANPSLAILRHRGEVRQAIFSRDGRAVATASDEEIKIWNADTGDLIREIAAHGVRGLTYSMNGQLLASAESHKARLWDARTGAELKAFVDPGGSQVALVGFSPDDTLLATASGASAYLWEVASGARLSTMWGHQGLVDDVAFSPDGRLLATAGGDSHRAYLWSIERVRSAGRVDTNGALGGVETHGVVRRVIFSPDGRWLVTASLTTGAQAWNVEDVGNRRRTDPTNLHGGSVIPMAFGRDGWEMRIVTAGEDGRARIKTLDGDSFKETAVINTQRAPRDILEEPPRFAYGTGFSPTDAGFSRDARRIVTANEDAAVKIWALTHSAISNAESWSLVSKLRGHRGAVTTASFSPNGSRVVTASKDGSAQIWDVGTTADFASVTALADLIQRAEQRMPRNVTASDRAGMLAR